MAIDDPYAILGLSSTATKQEVRARYKELAMANHPDKLQCLDINEKTSREEYFKQVTVAYHMIMEGGYVDNQSQTNSSYWRDIWERVSKKSIWETFVHVAQNYIRRKHHKVTVAVSLKEVRLSRKKKVQLFLKGIADPFRTIIDCSEYPMISYEFEAADSSYHHVDIALVTKEDKLYDIDEDGNLYTYISISWTEYLNGTTKQLPYLDDKSIDICISPFHDLNQRIVISGYGIKPKFDLFVNVEINGCKCEKWLKLSAPEQSQLLCLLEKIC